MYLFNNVSRGILRQSLALSLAIVLVAGGVAVAQTASTASSSTSLEQVKRELKRVEAERRSERKALRQLQQQINAIEARDARLEKAARQLQAETQQAQAKSKQARAQTESKLSQLETKVQAATSGRTFGSEFSSYLGSHQVTLVGDAAFDFIYDRGQDQIHSTNNTFNLKFSPIFLYQVEPWILFEGTVTGHLNETTTHYTLPVADFQLFLNDYLEVVAGIFDMPFGEFYEDYSAVWVNRFITAPVPYDINAIVPPTDIGMQARGAFQWGRLGQDVDYTVWMGNGATFANCPAGATVSCVVPGDELNGQTNIHYQSNGLGYGARFRFYPLPVDSNLGYLELGASTYDSKYFDNLWMYTWGVDFAYHRGNLQARGEYMQMFRQMPVGVGSDHREGFWFEVGYFLNGYQLPWVSDTVNRQFQKLEPLVRFSGVDQPAVLFGETPYAAPGVSAISLGFNGSPALFTPYSRELALGLDYWIAPSIVWQNELDLEMPESGGYYSDTRLPVGATPNDRAFLTQFAIGF